MYGYGYRYAGSGSGKVAGLDPVVQAFVTSNGITSTSEINALNSLYVGINNLLTSHGSGSILYLNGISPTSLTVAREAIVYGTGKQTAVDIVSAPTHSNDGVAFNGTNNGWNIGAVTNGVNQDRILTAYSRTNTITVAGVSFGTNTGTGEDIQMLVRTTASPSGYNVPANYTGGQNFAGAGNWLGYNNGTTYGLWHDGIYQTPDATNAPVSSASKNTDCYLGCRNNSGAANFVDERIGLLLMLDDGGSLFSQTEIETLDTLMFNYNENVV